MRPVSHRPPGRSRPCLRVGLLVAALLAGSVAWASEPAAPPNGADGQAAIVALIDAGQFKVAEAQIAQSLADDRLAPQTREALEFQRERMRRILIDFTLSEDEAKARVRKQIPDLKDDEFAKWDAAGLLEHQTIDGRKLYFSRAPSNLFRLSAEARARRAQQTPFNDSPLEKSHPHHKQVHDEAIASGRSSAAPHSVRVTQSITVDADAVPAGETLRAWVPYPRAIAGQQENIRFVASVPAKHQIAPESAMQRTVYLEQPAEAGKKTTFSITYELDIYGRYHAMDPDKVVPVQPTPELAPFLGERPPHIVFTDDMRKFSREVVGDEKNPYRIAKKLYEAVDRIPWAGAREYSTITNISDYALHAGHGDCGQVTLLLMTLLRMNGIPSRWQSGMIFSDGEYNNLHDWGQMYLAPYGWVPVDVSFGRLADAPAELQDFYFGGIDGYRIAFNDDYGRDFAPKKEFFRSETVDLQRGEVEWKGGNLYFDQWDYDFEWKVLPRGAAKDTQ
ncbi:transglutaminase-like domain-containing protein [Luteimonas sp. SX5]|uniref:Transglutaminase-like domain-containing protein n=1 Tax=Luteimonas galliterrae TaxID=2940486 RepID=A0ABT0MGE7_9GAMM|nr:transglutaminase-like domain-containing protein [Luteimonas galliterrae]MCL1633945.1 transglutaminase-like domain-containing protein [Luteimonas galliterrae]